MLRRHMVLCTCELSACSVKTHCVPWASLRKSFRLATSVGPGCGRCFAEPFFAGIARTNQRQMKVRSVRQTSSHKTSSGHLDHLEWLPSCFSTMDLRPEPTAQLHLLPRLSAVRVV